MWGWSGAAGRIRAAPRREFLVDPQRARARACAASSSAAAPASSPTRLVESGCELAAVDISEASVERSPRPRRRARARSSSGTSRPAKGSRAASSTRSSASACSTTSTSTPACAHVPAAPGPEGVSRSASRTCANPQVWAERSFEPLRRVAPRAAARDRVPSRRAPPRVRDARARGRGLRAVRVPPPADAGLAHGAVDPLEGVLEATPLRAIAGSIRIAGSRP